MLPGIVAGSVFVETIFGWPGMGRLMVTSIVGARLSGGARVRRCFRAAGDRREPRRGVAAAMGRPTPAR